MKAMRNAAHLGILGIWAVFGVLFTLQSVFGAHVFMPSLAFWGWFAGFAALTSWLVTMFDSPLGALSTHGLTFLALHLVPKVFPFALVRLGLDLLAGHSLPFLS